MGNDLLARPVLGNGGGTLDFEVLSEGLSGGEWVTQLKKLGYTISERAESLISSASFQPVAPAKLKISALKGRAFVDSGRTLFTKVICAEADELKLVRSRMEIACLLRKRFSNSELEGMGIWEFVVMHEPVKDSSGTMSVLCVPRTTDGKSWVDATSCYPGDKWNPGHAFVFEG